MILTRPYLGIFALALLTLACALIGLSVGAVALAPSEVLEVVLGTGSDQARRIVLGLRAPRVLMAAVVGAGLAVSGVVFQALLRNPLAEPYVLGVSSGASVGAVLAIVLGATATSVIALPMSAFAGAVLAMTLVLAMASVAGRGLDTTVLLLAGVVIGAFFNAVIMLVVNFTDTETFRAAILWMMGSFSGSSWRGVAAISAYVVPAIMILGLTARPLNLLSVSEQSSFHLGVDIRRFKGLLYIVTSLVVGACVAGAGAIGFVGLVVPHALRLVGGTDHRWLLPAAALTGASFMVLSDTVSRVVFAPVELPVGVVTALIGVPVFLWLLVRSGSAW